MPWRSRLGLIAATFLLLTRPGWDAAVQTVPWAMDDPMFGGFSAIEIAPDGQGFIAVTDRGAWTRGRLIRTQNGRIVRITAEPLRKIAGPDGLALPVGRTDSEGLAVSPGGTLFLSFEGPARVARFDRLDGPAEDLPTAPAFGSLPRPAALEALALLPDLTLIAVAEDTRGPRAGFPVFRFDGRGWSLYATLPRQGRFLPVAADLGPDHRLYVLERALYGLRGFSSQVRAFALGPDGIDSGVTVMQSAPGTHQNLEGLSVWQDASGSVRLTMIVDDNFVPFQTTEIVEYRLPD